MDDLNSASGSMTEAIAEVRNLLNSLDGTLGYNDTALSQLQSFCSEMASACDALLTGLDALENTFSMQGGTAVPDTTQLRESIAALRDASVSFAGDHRPGTGGDWNQRRCGRRKRRHS